MAKAESVDTGTTGRNHTDRIAQLSRIDVHHHFTPPEYTAELDVMKIIPPPQRAWTPSSALEQMDEGQVATSMLSITTPGIWFGSHRPARRLARICNEYAAGLVQKHPGRFGLFVNLPMPDIEGSLEEIAYGLDVLKADGVALFTNYESKWLGDPAFDVIFDELNRRRAVLYTHPTVCACCVNLVPGVIDMAIEYQTDTTRALARLVFSGTAARCPDIRVIWSHGGGTMPFLTHRFVNMARMPQYREKFPDGFMAVARRFYYDTAQVPNQPALAALKGVAPVSRILFGTDFPWGTAAQHAKGIAEANVFSSEELAAIDHENAWSLFPRLRVDSPDPQ